MLNTSNTPSTSTEQDLLPAVRPVTLETCERYAVIDPVFRDRIDVKASKLRFWRKRPEQAALEGVLKLHLLGDGGWDTTPTYDAFEKARYDDGWAVVDVTVKLHRFSLTGGPSYGIPSRKETVTVWVKAMGPESILAEM